MPAFYVPANYAFDTYSALSAGIADWMDRSDLTGAIPGMIALAEARIRRTVEPLLSEQAADITFAAGAGALPSDCSMPVTLRYAGRRRLDQAPLSAALDYANNGEPEAFTLERGGIYVWPAVDCVATLIYRPLLTPLSEANPSNWLLQTAPDLYFTGSMLYAEGYTANDSRAVTFAGMFDSILSNVVEHLNRQATSGPLVPRLECP
jgi:hypothetical protein